VTFKVILAPASAGKYFELAAELRPGLQKSERFISIERPQSRADRVLADADSMEAQDGRLNIPAARLELIAIMVSRRGAWAARASAVA
jgi:hypothetical protein